MGFTPFPMRIAPFFMGFALFPKGFIPFPMGFEAFPLGNGALPVGKRAIALGEFSFPVEKDARPVGRHSLDGGVCFRQRSKHERATRVLRADTHGVQYRAATMRQRINAKTQSRKGAKKNRNKFILCVSAPLR